MEIILIHLSKRGLCFSADHSFCLFFAIEGLYDVVFFCRYIHCKLALLFLESIMSRVGYLFSQNQYITE